MTAVTGFNADASPAGDSPSQPDLELLAAVRVGDPAAFDRFVDRFGPMILAFGLRMCGHREDAEDVFQETLIKAFTQLKTLDAPGALKTWLWLVVANECRMSRRGPRDPSRSVALEDLRPEGAEGPPAELPDTGGVSPEEQAIRAQNRELLERALAELTPEQRLMILLRDFEGLSTADAAQVLGITEANAKVRLHRARLALRGRMIAGSPRREASL
jgi:RNA polymerase sigma-70 factor (ECF subfamily)